MGIRTGRGVACLAVLLCPGCRELNPLFDEPPAMDGSGTGSDATSTSTDPSTETNDGASSAASGSQTGADDSTDGPTGDGWLDPDFSWRKPIVVHGRAEALTDYPLGVVLPEDLDLSATASLGAEGLAFTADDGESPLDFEVEWFEASSGALTAWVRLPQLPPEVDTLIYLYYGGSGEPNSARPEDAWSDRFAGVWHMHQTSPGLVHDSTEQQHHAVAAMEQTSPVDVPSVMGRGAQFDGLDDGLDVGDPLDGSLDFEFESFSYSLWVWVEAPVGNYDIAFTKGASNASSAGYNVELGDGSWRAHVGDGVANRPSDFGDYLEFLGSWTHLVVVVDRDANQLRLYANGQWVDEDDLSTLGSTESGRVMNIGRTDNFFFAGTIDEVRLHREALGEIWITTAWRNAIDPDTVLTVGAAEAQPG